MQERKCVMCQLIAIYYSFTQQILLNCLMKSLNERRVVANRKIANRIAKKLVRMIS